MPHYNADRFLVSLGQASTSRVLNLWNIAKKCRADPDYRLRPLLVSPILNSGFVLKQSVRPGELHQFDQSRAFVTKIILPSDPKDLLAGGRALIVGERGFEESVRSLGNYSDASAERDLKVLQLLDALPSLDPFLLREHLSNYKIEVATCYFAISASDQTSMREVVTAEMEQLTMLLGSGASRASTQRMVAALLSNDVAEELAPLRVTLNMSGEAFRNGVFSWRGFLYYKWSMQRLWPQIMDVLRHIKGAQPSNGAIQALRSDLEAGKARIITMVRDNGKDITEALAVYDRSYSSLVAKQAPGAFREFLLAAPSMFMTLGEKIGAISHIITFWKYRFPEERLGPVAAEELNAIFEDFCSGFAERIKAPVSPLKQPVVIDARKRQPSESKTVSLN